MRVSFASYRVRERVVAGKGGGRGEAAFPLPQMNGETSSCLSENYGGSFDPAEEKPRKNRPYRL